MQSLCLRESTKRPRVNRVRVTPLMTLTLGLLATFLVGGVVWNSEQTSQDRYVRAEAARWVGAIVNAFERSVSAVESLAGALQRDTLSRTAFHEYAKDIFATQSAVRTVEWVPRVASSDLISFEQRAQSEGLSGFTITERADNGKLQSAAPRAFYYPVHYAEGVGGNAPVLGFDLGSTEAQLKAMSEALDRGVRTVTTPVVHARSASSGQASIAVLKPVYRGTALPESVEQRRANLRGFALVVIDMAETVETTLKALEKGLFLVELKDTTRPDAITVFESSTAGEFEASDTPIVSHFELSGRAWRIELTPSANLTRNYGGILFWLVLMLGVLVSATAAVFLRGAQRETERVTAEMTRKCDQAQSAAANARDLLEGVREGVIGLSADEHVLFINGPARRALGLYQEVLDRPFRLVMTEVGADGIQAFETGYVGDASAEYTDPTTGEARLLKISAQAIEPPTDSLLSRLITLSDVTDERECDEISMRLGPVMRGSVYELYIFQADTLCCLTSNELAQNNTGYLESELANLSPSDILEPSTFEQFQAALESLGGSGSKLAEYEGNHRRKDGSTYPVSTHLVYASDETPPVVYALAQDISERVAVRQQLQRTAASLEEAQQVAQMGSFELNREQGKVTWSANLTRILQLNSDVHELDEYRFRGNVHPEDSRALAKAVDEALEARAPYRIDYRVALSDGSERYMRERGVPRIGDDGRCHLIVGAIQDVTNQSNSEAEFRRAQRMDAVARLAGGIAHDFNNSLGIIIGNLDLLSLQPLNDKARRHAETALGAATRGAELSQQLLTFARRDVNRLSNANVNELLERELRSKVEGIIQGEVDVSYDFGVDIWPVEVESGELVSAITNLVINASDALQGRPGKIVVETRNRVSAPSGNEVFQGEFVDIVVSDNGIGIPREHLESVFDPFYTTKEDTGGAGLGLAMVYAFAKRFGGGVKANSEVGYGSAFRVSLPRSGVEIRRTAEDEPLELISGNGESILVVDDQEELAAVAVEYLESAGYNVKAATGASDALDLLKSEPFDLVFSDIVMPGGMNGFALATEVEKKYAEVRILLTSGFTAAASDARDPEARRRRLLSKPYSRAQLLSAVRLELE